MAPILDTFPVPSTERPRLAARLLGALKEVFSSRSEPGKCRSCGIPLAADEVVCFECFDAAQW